MTIRRPFRSLMVLATAAALASLSAGTVGATTVPDESVPGESSAPVDPAAQAIADEAIAGFEQRMTESGLVDVGPLDDDGDEEGDDPDDLDEFETCNADAGELLESLDGFADDAFPGQIAVAESGSFVAASAVPTTSDGDDEFGSFMEGEESVQAIVSITDGSGTTQVDALIELMGSQDFADCMKAELERQFMEELEADDEDLDIPPPEVTITATPDVGVGDASSRFEMGVSIVFMVPIDIEVDFVVARQGDNVVLVMHATAMQEQALDVDLVAEAAAIADDLAA